MPENYAGTRRETFRGYARIHVLSSLYHYTGDWRYFFFLQGRSVTTLFIYTERATYVRTFGIRRLLLPLRCRGGGVVYTVILYIPPINKIIIKTEQSRRKKMYWHEILQYFLQTRPINLRHLRNTLQYCAIRREDVYISAAGNACVPIYIYSMHIKRYIT
jgi:hypothetical protein